MKIRQYNLNKTIIIITLVTGSTARPAARWENFDTIATLCTTPRRQHTMYLIVDKPAAHLPFHLYSQIYKALMFLLNNIYTWRLPLWLSKELYFFIRPFVPKNSTRSLPSSKLNSIKFTALITKLTLTFCFYPLLLIKLHYHITNTGREIITLLPNVAGMFVPLTKPMWQTGNVPTQTKCFGPI